MDEEPELDDPAAIKARALFDPLRFRLFGLMRTPHSVPELARAVEMPADRLYYHVRRLVECGLVHQVDARVAGRHTERIFGRTAERVTFSGELDLGGESSLRSITHELEDGLRSAAGDDPASVSYHVVSLTDARARELEKRLRGLIAEYDDRGRVPKGARRYGVLGVLAPLRKEETA
jgi:DNA-binding transcriptional ArsR family regulator